MTYYGHRVLFLYQSRGFIVGIRFLTIYGAAISNLGDQNMNLFKNYIT